MIRWHGLPILSVVWMKNNLRPNDMILMRKRQSAPFEYYLRREHVPLVRRPMPCDPRSTDMFASKAEFAGEATADGARFLMLTLWKDWPASYPRCTVGLASTSPQIVYSRRRVKIYADNSQAAKIALSRLGLR